MMKRNYLYAAALLAGLSFLPAAAQAANADPLMAAVQQGLSEEQFIALLAPNGWTEKAGSPRTYTGSEPSTNPKPFEESMTYTTEKGRIKQVSIILKNGNKVVAEKRFKQISSDFSKTLGRWTCDGLLSGDGFVAAKYNLWFLPKASVMLKVKWTREARPFLTSDKTETVSYTMMNY